MAEITYIKDENGQELTIVKVRGIIRKITPRGGLLLELIDEDKDIWFPITHCYNPVEELEEENIVDLEVSEWIATKNGVI